MAKELNEVKPKYDDIIKTAQDNSINSPVLESIKYNVSKLISMKNKRDSEKALEIINEVLKDNKLKNLVETEIKLKETMKMMERYGEGKISIKVHRLI